MSEFVRPNVSDSVISASLQDGHHAKKFTAGLPGWHPVRELFTGPSQWLGQLDPVYCLFRLFSALYGDRIQAAGDEGLLQAASLPDVERETVAFKRNFPNSAIWRGKRWKLHLQHAEARASIEAATCGQPRIREFALRDFDNTFAKLVRAVRWS
jgi:hypothetical protein